MSHLDAEGLTEIRCRCGTMRLPIGQCLACNSYAAVDRAGDEGRMLSQDEIETLCTRAGRVHGPALLLSAWQWEIISAAVVTAMAGPAWSGAEYPEQALGRRQWAELFAVAGFTIDGKAAARPVAPVTLWRGSVHARCRGMAWTSDREVAEKFAAGELYGRVAGSVYQVTAPPEAILCVDNGRQEAEHVLDTRGLTIREAALAESSRPQ